MAANEMQGTWQLLVERDPATGEETLIVKNVTGASGPTIANVMQPSTRLLVEREASTGQEILLVRFVV